MSDPLRYRVVDEPRPGPMQRVALPPLLVFMVAVFFMPWGLLLIALNALALGGPHRWREIALAAGAIAIYFVFRYGVAFAVGLGAIPRGPAPYLFVLGIGLGLALASFAYISQARTMALRRYLASGA